MVLKHTCHNCESEFTIKYDVEKCDDDPQFCPFCGEYIIHEEDELEDDDE
jgi:predicted  nucleic acid-binding Zn-ribbon protein